MCEDLSLLWVDTPRQGDDLMHFLEKSLGARPSLLGFVGHELLGATLDPVFSYLKYGVLTIAALGVIMGVTWPQ